MKPDDANAEQIKKIKKGEEKKKKTRKNGGV